MEFDQVCNEMFECNCMFYLCGSDMFKLSKFNALHFYVEKRATLGLAEIQT